jgi:hypothetical protein
LTTTLVAAAAGSALGCGGRTLDAGDTSSAPDPGAVAAVPMAQYPSDLIATYAPNGAGVSLFTYDTATGFVPVGGITNDAWADESCEQLTFDAQRNLYLTCTSYGAGRPTSRVIEYASGSTDDSPPLRVLTAPIIDTSFLLGSAVDSKGNVYVVASSLTGEDAGTPHGAVVVFGPDSDTVPTRIIRGDQTQLDYPNNVAVDSSDRVYVGTASYPALEFAPDADGNAAPLEIVGAGACAGTEGVALDGAGDVFVDCTFGGGGGSDGPPYSIAEISGGKLVRTISGSATGITSILSTALDHAGRIYVANFYDSDGTSGVSVFGQGASGDVPPEAKLSTVSGFAVAVAP